MRKKWNEMSDKDKENLMEVIRERMLDLTEKRESLEEEYNCFEEINDQIQDTFECDMKCETCDEVDRARCMQSFRIANVYWIKKLRLYEDYFLKTLETSLDVLKELILLLKDSGSPAPSNYFS